MAPLQKSRMPSGHTFSWGICILSCGPGSFGSRALLCADAIKNIPDVLVFVNGFLDGRCYQAAIPHADRCIDEGA